MEQPAPPTPALSVKAGPLMTPDERRAKWQAFRRDATFDTEDFIAHIEQGRDEADRPS